MQRGRALYSGQFLIWTGFFHFIERKREPEIFGDHFRAKHLCVLPHLLGMVNKNHKRSCRNKYYAITHQKRKNRESNSYLICVSFHIGMEQVEAEERKTECHAGPGDMPAIKVCGLKLISAIGTSTFVSRPVRAYIHFAITIGERKKISISGAASSNYSNGSLVCTQ